MNNFSYGFRMQPEQLIQIQGSDNQKKLHQNKKYQDYNQDQDESDDLFKIGNKKIQNIQEKRKHNHINQQKHKKDKKDKKIKKQKHKKNKEKHEKGSRKQQINQISSQSENKSNCRQEFSSTYKQYNDKILLYNKDVLQKNRLIESQNKYIQKLHSLNMISKKNVQKSLDFVYGKTLQQRLQKDFAVNQKIKEGLLLFDIVNFPMNQLYLYGNIDKDVPVFQRAINFPFIIGVKKSKQKKYKKIMQQLNIMIRQKETLQNFKEKAKDKARQNRYFHYEGYEKIKGQYLQANQELTQQMQNATLYFQQQKNNKSISNSKTNQHVYVKSDEYKYRQVTKQYNIKLNQQPNNIQIWLQFLQIQDKLFTLSQGYASQNKQAALAQRKLSILQKALQKNPYNDRLGTQYFDLLFKFSKPIIYEMSTEKQLIKFIQTTPQNYKLWLSLLNIKLQSFQKFSHTFIKSTFQQFNNLIQSIIKKTNSAQKIWKIRTASLKILQKFLSIYNQSGYSQLSTALGISLLQYNIFMPENIYKLSDQSKKKQQFKKYFESNHHLKIGDSDLYTSWETFPEIDGQVYLDSKNDIAEKLKQNMQSFIGNYQETEEHSKNQDQLSHKVHNQLQQIRSWIQIEQSFKQWRPSNVNFKPDKQRIKKSPQSFVLIEDIEHTLLNYRDHANILILIDIVLENMSFPAVFKQNQIDSKFSSVILDYLFTSFSNQNTENNQTKQCLHLMKTVKVFTGFWPPQCTKQLFPQIEQLLYVKRILKFIKQKLKPMFISSKKIQQYSRLNQYLIFLIGCIYADSQLIRKLGYQKQTQQKLKGQIQQILCEQPENSTLWAIYIQFQYVKSGKNNEILPQIFKVFQLWLKSLASKQKQIQCLFCYWQFKICNNIQSLKNVNILEQVYSIFLQIHSDRSNYSIQEQKQDIKLNIQRRVSSLQHLQIQNILFQKIIIYQEYFQKINQQRQEQETFKNNIEGQHGISQQFYFYLQFVQGFSSVSKNQQFIQRYSQLLIQIKKYSLNFCKRSQQRIPKIICKLYQLTQNSYILKNQQFLTQQQQNQFDSLSKFPYFWNIVLNSKRFSHTRPLHIYEIFYNSNNKCSGQKKSIVSWLWLSAYLLFTRSSPLSIQTRKLRVDIQSYQQILFMSQIVRNGKLLAFGSIQNQNVDFIKLLLKISKIVNKLVKQNKNKLSLDSIINENDSKVFCFKCINKIPYCKQLYINYLQQLLSQNHCCQNITSSTLQQCINIFSLMQQKQLRIVQKSYRKLQDY